jgi:hypothetical protein
LLALCAWFADRLVALPLPAFRAEICLIDDNIFVRGLELTRDNSHSVIRLRANLERPMSYGGAVVLPLGWHRHVSGWYQIDLNATAILQAPVVFMILILSWPVRGLRHLVLRLGAALPLLLLLLAADKPLDILGNFQHEVIAQLDQPGVPPLYAWARFLEGGGNCALALGFAYVAILVGNPRANRSSSRVPAT